MKTAGRIAKWTVIFIIYFLIALVIFRCCFAAERSTLSDITPTDALRAAYRADPSLEMQTHKVVAEIAQDGYMSCYALVYIPSIRQLQLTVRYNDSIYRYNSLPEGLEFSFTLTDSDSGAAVPALVTASEEKLMYNYRRLVFTDVTITETNDLVLTMWAGDETISTDTVHYADQNVVIEPYKLSRAEKKLLA